VPPSPLTADLVIVGAGPAGTAAAITAARSGRRVSVIDKAIFPRDKFCGDGLTTGALRLLDDLGLDPGAIPSWQQVDDATISSPSGRTVTFPLPRGDGMYAVVAERRELDAAMVDLARSSGATIHEGSAVTAVRSDADRVVVTADGLGDITAPYAIAADGMWSPVRKLLGLATPGYLGDWHAFRQYFHNVEGQQPNQLHVWFEPDVLPGYIWSFPLPDHRANVGFGIVRGDSIATSEMRSMWADILERPAIRAVLGPDAEPEHPPRAWPIPARVGKVPLAAGRALVVGDAAAVSDPMTGEGIGQALVTGIRAAEAVATAGDADPARAAAVYESAVRRELVVDHRLAEVLGRVLRSPRGARGAVRVSGLTPWSRRHFARWLFEDYPRAAVATPRRWHRGMFTGAGAFRGTGRPGSQ